MSLCGFTGTKVGMSVAQIDTFLGLVRDVTEFHHGDCWGADWQAHFLVLFTTPYQAKIVIHPPAEDVLRAYCSRATDPQLLHRLTTLLPLPYLVRNHAIVDAVEWMIVTPRTQREEVRSGTWATYRYALKRRLPLVVIWPDGTTTEK